MDHISPSGSEGPNRGRRTSALQPAYWPVRRTSPPRASSSATSPAAQACTPNRSSVATARSTSPAGSSATMPTPQLRVASRSSWDTPPTRRTTSKTGAGAQVAAVDGRRELLGHHPREVRGEAAAGDVRHRVDAGLARRARGTPWRRSGSARAAPRRACGRARRRRGRAPSRPARAGRGGPGSSRWSAARWTPSPRPRRRGAPGRGRAGRSASTTPVAAPATSYSSGSSRPGCSAVSPPIRAQPASTHASAMPFTIAAIRSGTTRPQAM